MLNHGLTVTLRVYPLYFIPRSSYPMTKNETTVQDLNEIPSHVNHTTPGKIRGYDKIASFLHEVNNIVAEECANHTPLEALPWYPTWEQWNDQHFL